MRHPFRATLSRRAFVRTLGAAVGAVSAGVALGGHPARAAPPPPSAGPALRQGSTGTLTFVDLFEPKAYADADVYVIREGIGQGLVRINFQSQFEGALATDWATVDATTWRFTLRSAVTFHNGVALDAGAVVANLQKLAEAKNAPAAFKGAAIMADSASTVTIRTAAPLPYLPAILADSKAVIYEPSASFGPDGTLVTPVSTGPFKLVDFKPGDRRVLEAHAGYWGGTPGVREVQYLVVPNGQTRANMVRSGEADIARIIAPTDVASLQTSSSARVLTTPLPRVRQLFLNTQGGPIRDVRVRMAIAHAVDREIVVQSVLENQAVSQAGLFSPSYPWGNPGLRGLPFDQAAARTLLAEAGYGPSSPLSITLMSYPSRPELPPLAQVLQQQLAEIGVQCEISIVDSTVMEAAELRGEYDIALGTRNPLFLFDPQAAFETDFSSAGSYNLTRYAGLDDQIAAAGTIQDQAERYARYRQLEQRIVEQDVATVVLNSYIQIDATRSNVTGYQPHPTDSIALTEQIAKS
jgi:peptide/nickel transport system substrate-binding protein